MSPEQSCGEEERAEEARCVCRGEEESGRRGCRAGGPPHEEKAGGRVEMLVHYAGEQIMSPAWVLVSVGAEAWQLLKQAPKET